MDMHFGESRDRYQEIWWLVRHNTGSSLNQVVQNVVDFHACPVQRAYVGFRSKRSAERAIRMGAMRCII